MSAPREVQDEQNAEYWADLPSYGMCTACGAIEAKLVEVTGVKDFSRIGESAEYPTGFGCEFCA